MKIIIQLNIANKHLSDSFLPAAPSNPVQGGVVVE